MGAIRAGKKLNKTPAPKEKGPGGAVSGGGGGGGGAGGAGAGRPMSLMEQMKAAQAKRKSGASRSSMFS